jgi:hypothetical protein
LAEGRPTVGQHFPEANLRQEPADRSGESDCAALLASRLDVAKFQG